MHLQREIRMEAAKLIRRHEEDVQRAADETRRRQKRSAVVTPGVVVRPPPHWDAAEGFNPYLTRARAGRIAHSIRASLASGDYRPRQPIEKEVPKPSGGTRKVSIFQVADSAVSRVAFESLLNKNLPLMSARAYAYRKDVSAQDAIHYVKSELALRPRTFIAEFDFSSFFDRIDPEHIRRNLHDYRFLVSPTERVVIDAFLTTKPAPVSSYTDSENRERFRGVPQGTSVSLFLANVAAWDLDRHLERTGAGFVRYADDTLLWSEDYATICRAVDLLQEHAQAMGVSVNLDKSPGIRILTAVPVTAEMSATSAIEFLGYQIGWTGTQIKDASAKKMQRHIASLIYWNLIHEPTKGTQLLSRVAPHVDRDYVTALSQIRSYLYGDLSEKTVRRYQNGDLPFRRFKGVMAAYPLLDDAGQLTKLDGWLANTLFLAMKKRRQLLAGMGMTSFPPPYGLPVEEFIRAKTTSKRTGERIDMRVPSFRRIARVIQRAAAQHGAGKVGRSLPYGAPYA